MKVRSGLVSNSSSSSFIIHYKDSLFIHTKSKKINQRTRLGKWKVVYLLTKEQVALLDQHNFRPCRLTHPSHLGYTAYDDNSIWINNKREENKEPNVSFAKWVTCNQDDEICFLVKNKIPFIASIHYGHQTCIYPKNSKYIYYFENIGSTVETYHQDATSKELDKLIEGWTRISQKISVKEFIKRRV